jgi:hypothetical protein
MNEDEINNMIENLLDASQFVWPNTIPRELCQQAAELMQRMRDRLEELGDDDGEDSE